MIMAGLVCVLAPILPPILLSCTLVQLHLITLYLTYLDISQAPGLINKPVWPSDWVHQPSEVLVVCTCWEWENVTAVKESLQRSVLFIENVSETKRQTLKAVDNDEDVDVGHGPLPPPHISTRRPRFLVTRIAGHFHINCGTWYVSFAIKYLEYITFKISHYQIVF